MIMLKVENLTKLFSGLVALDNVNLHVNESEILGLIGPNGAGKSTLINVVSGFYTPTRGKVVFAEQDITGLKTHQIARLGITRIFQTSTLFVSLSVLDNVFIGYHMAYRTSVWRRVLHMPSARTEQKILKQKSMEVLEFMGLGNAKDKIAENLPHGSQRTLDVCMALSTSPRLLLLDEPVTGILSL